MIANMLDLDLYKLLMMQFVWAKHRNVNVKYEFKNRSESKHPLRKHLSLYEADFRLGDLAGLRFTRRDTDYLHSLNIFDPDFLNALTQWTPSRLVVRPDGDDKLSISTEGKWFEAILWETLVLATVNEAYNNNLTLKRQSNYGEVQQIGLRRLLAKRDILRESVGQGNWLAASPIVDFGTRRRYSQAWQQLALNILLLEKVVTSTSNLNLAREFAVFPVGTYAHEMEMAMMGIYPSATAQDFGHFHRQFMSEWAKMYPNHTIGLPDTFGTDFYFNATPRDMMGQWRGLRHDSGNPFEFLEKTLEWYRGVAIDPRDHTIVFSDGLDVNTIIKLGQACYGQIRCSFGWGTDLMNDCGNEPLSIVMKLTEVEGLPVVKLSDNIAKANGNPGAVERVSKLLNYSGKENVECRV